jgi:multiple sugar transport system permease protein
MIMTTLDQAQAPGHAAPAAGEKKRRPGLRRAGGNLVRILLVGFFAFPLLFMFMSSLKPDDQIFADLDSIKAFLPVGDISLANYTGVFQTVPAGRFLINSIAITTVTVLVGLVVNSMAAFALSRMRWRGKTLVLAAVIATLVVPFETFALPLLWWVNKLPWALFQDGQFFYTTGWLDTYRVQIFPFLANAFSIYLFYSYFQSIPTTLDEAARVDGAGWFRIYRKVVMPLAGPAIATVAILTFLPAWNSFLWPLMVVQTENLRPVMVGISYFQQLKVLWGQIMAYSVLITIPVLAMFLALQRQFIRSIASAGVKG